MCVAFSTTYYQYSYQVNKLNNVTSESNRKIFAPNWTYSLANKGVNNGISYPNAYNVLREVGAVTINAQPIVDNYQVWPSNDEDEKVEALKTRLISDGQLGIPNNQNISSPSNLISNNFSLSDVKAKLNDGYVLVASSKGFFNSDFVNGKCIAYRCYQGGTSSYSHSLTIVGYDNYLEYDVNGNGTIESCEKGAFKVANSWGTSFYQNGLYSEDGFFWVMYDALNLNSTNTYNLWESAYSTTRYPAFCLTLSPGANNVFRYIEVGHKDVKLIGELDINVHNKFNFDLHANVNTTGHIGSYGLNNPLVHPYTGANPKEAPFNGIILFDFTDKITQCIGENTDYYNGYYYNILLANFSISDYSNSLSFRLLDSEGNIVSDYVELTNPNIAPALSHYIDFDIGDVNYDGALNSSDVTLILQHCAISRFSVLQKELGDFNGDGTVSASDAIALNAYLAGNGQNAFSELELQSILIQYGSYEEVSL